MPLYVQASETISGFIGLPTIDNKYKAGIA
jgi:hypothetical protein